MAETRTGQDLRDDAIMSLLSPRNRWEHHEDDSGAGIWVDEPEADGESSSNLVALDAIFASLAV